MPFEHEVEVNNHLLCIRCAGGGSIAEMEDSAKRVFESFITGAVPKDFGILINLDGCDALQNPVQEKRMELCIGLLQSCMRGRVAIVSTVVGKVIPAHVVAINAGHPGHDVMAFTEEKMARLWLSS